MHIFLLIQTSSGPTQHFVQWVPVVLAQGVKRGRGVMLTAHPLLVPRSGKSISYTSFPSKRHPWRVAGRLYLFQHF
jgi:hypothetical protein